MTRSSCKTTRASPRSPRWPWSPGPAPSRPITSCSRPCSSPSSPLCSWGSRRRARRSPRPGISSITCSRPSDDEAPARRSSDRAPVPGSGPGDARMRHRLPRGLGLLALAPVPHPHLRHRAVRRPRSLRVPGHGPALPERRSRHAGLHGRVRRARAGARAPGRRPAPPPERRPPGRALAPPPAVGAALGRDGQALRVALPSLRRPRELPPGRPEPQLARRPPPRARERDPGRRVADHALRRAPLLRAPAVHRSRALRGGPGGRRRRARHLRPDHAPAAQTGAAHRAPLPHARRAPSLRHHVRPDRRRSRQYHGERHRLRVPEPLPDSPARPGFRDRRGGLRDRHARGVGLSHRPASRGSGPMRRVRRIADVMVLLLLAAYAVPFFWQLLTSFKPDALLLRLPPVVPTQLTTAHYQAVWEKSVIPRALGNSLAVAGLTTVLALVLGLTAAYALARLPVPGTGALLLGVVAGTAFPQIAIVSPLYLLIRALGLRD